MLCVVQAVSSPFCVEDDKTETTAPRLETRTSRLMSRVFWCTLKNRAPTNLFTSSRFAMTKCALRNDEVRAVRLISNLIASETALDSESSF